MASNKELQAAYKAGAEMVVNYHRPCSCTDDVVRGFAESFAQQLYPAQTQPRVVRFEAGPWSEVAGESVEYRVVDGVIQGRNPLYDNEWGPSETFVLRDGDVYIYPGSPWAGALEIVQDLVANPTEEVDG